MAAEQVAQLPADNPTSKNLFNSLDSLFDQLCSEQWHGSLSFPMDKGATGTVEDVDLCQYFKKKRFAAGYLPKKASAEDHKATRLYFPPANYPPPILQEDGSGKLHPDCPAYNKLKQGLQSAAFTCGCPIVSNGSNKGTCKDKMFVCAFRHRVYKRFEEALQSGRQDSIVNSDKAGRRQNGRAKARRTHTKLALPGEKTCNFKLVISWDQFGFYLKQTAGCSMHCGHPKTAHRGLALPTRLVPQGERQVVMDMAEACAGSGIARNYIYKRLGQFIPTANLKYIQDRALLPQLAHNDPRSLPASDVQGLLRYFEQETSISYQVLWDVPTITDADGNDGHALVSQRYVKDNSGQLDY